MGYTAGAAFGATAVGGQKVGTYQFRAPELFVQQACRYPSDVWSLGASIVNMDLGEVPFGKDRMLTSYETLVFWAALAALSTWKKPTDFDLKMLRGNSDAARRFLSGLQLKSARLFPWGQTRGLAFKEFTKQFFVIVEHSRPLARNIARVAHFLQDAS